MTPSYGQFTYYYGSIENCYVYSAYEHPEARLVFFVPEETETYEFSFIIWDETQQDYVSGDEVTSDGVFYIWIINTENGAVKTFDSEGFGGFTADLEEGVIYLIVLSLFDMDNPYIQCYLNVGIAE